MQSLQQISIELTNACNGGCIICPNRVSDRSVTHIDLWVFEKLVIEIAKLNIFSEDKALGLCGVGEPLLHPEFERIAQICAKHNVPYGLGTNGSTFYKHIDFILDTPPEEVCFSIDGTTEESYKKIRPLLDLDTVREGARDYLLRLRAEDHTPNKIWVQMVVTKDNVHEVNDYIKEWLPYTEPVGAKIFFKCVSPWPHYDVNSRYPSPIPNIDEKYKKRVVMAGFDPPETFRASCDLFNMYLNVLSDGTYVPCCSPTKDYWGLGNASDTGILEVFYGRKMNELRETPKDKIPFCRDCI